eukprot:TRINITY_DN8019_c0_g1_i1.p1 TRINITY_DN8019_c0_g1~~TRINITY_DN8019_c0_g1_i1.p1  ORF type:complete len:359 (+),score=63.28 TRINITY_DN8019_c0_g1_i1:55-1131(+)
MNESISNTNQHNLVDWESCEESGLDINTLDSSERFKMKQFETLLSADYIDIQKLKSICWNGIPVQYRAICWQLLLGYMPTVKDRRVTTMKKKRKEYWSAVKNIYQEDEHERTDYENEIYHQIEIDVLRTNAAKPLYVLPEIRLLQKRILYVWSIRHPASGYVQGINDLVPPFLTLFLINFSKDTEIENCSNIDFISPALLNDIEADCYWCTNALIEDIQDNYIVKQPGIHAMMGRLEDLLKIVNKSLYDHIHNLEILFVQFAFRWMNCLLLRELPQSVVYRLWDTYLSDDDYPKLHVFVCLVLLQKWSNLLLSMDFADFMIFIQDLPTDSWDEEEISTILSEAFVLQYTYEDAIGHIQ